jgi:ribonuclease H / adenosylcobalamin/alpha-ribazole phosphatase
MPGESVVYLVRHGESVGNVNPAARRRDDPPLTDRGRAQANQAAAALARIGIDAVFSSPLRRARETADAIGAASGVGVRVVDGFGEVDMGALSDPDTPEERRERDAIFSAWLAGDRSRPFPEGEDFPAVLRRVREGLRTVLEAAAPARIAVVTHRIPIAAAAELCEPGGTISFGACPNGSITTLQPEAGDRWHLVAWGDARHLA